MDNLVLHLNKEKQLNNISNIKIIRKLIIKERYDKREKILINKQKSSQTRM